MLMLTTGLRVGGVVKILVNNVADVRNGAHVVRDQGRTKEKGGRFEHFPICPAVKEIFQDWLATHRRADAGPFLLPGAIESRCLTTECVRRRFKAMCDRLQLEGPEFHPHALRHTHAHILLECGNSLETVSKSLHHKSVTVTQQVYLKESAAEVMSRINAPWARMETAEQKKKRTVQGLPTFLREGMGGQSRSAAASCSTSATGDDEERRAKRKRRRAESQALMESFRPPTGADAIQ